MNKSSATSLAATLWGPIPANLQPKDLKPFLAYYRHQFSHANLQAPLPTLPDLSRITALITSDTPRATILSALQLSHPKSSPPYPNATLDLTARLLVLVPFGDWDAAARPDDPPPPNWDDSTSLRETLTNIFPPSDPPACDPSLAFPATIDAFALPTDAGIAVHFTDDLAKHLRIVTVDGRGNKAVLVFHHATVLETIAASSSGSVLPKGLAAETLRTLALLFPSEEFSSMSRFSGSKKGKWLRHVIGRWEDAAGVGRIVDVGVVRGQGLKEEERLVEGFWFWRERLMALKVAFERTVGDGKWKGVERGGNNWARFAGMTPVPVVSGF